MDPDQNWKELYIGWLTEVRDAAAAKNLTYREKNYAKALSSVQSANISNETPKQLKKLPGVGEKTVDMLVKKALKWSKDNNLTTEWYESIAAPIAENRTNSAVNGTSGSSATNSRRYVPRYGTTTYHLIVGLRQLEKLDPGQGFGRDAIIRHIKPRLMTNQGGSYHKLLPSLTPALAMLSSKGLIFSRSRQYFLEQQGRELANKFIAVEKDAQRELGNLVSSDHDPLTPVRTVRQFESPDAYSSTVWKPQEYSIKLLLDNREISTADNRSGFKDALESLGVNIVVLPLPVGDCCWVAEHNTTHRRAVLDVIIERKRLDDLVASIIDGRFKEQKQRLEKSAIPHIVYLVEKVGGDKEFLAKHIERIQTSMSQTITHNSFYLRETANQTETVSYMQQMTLEICRRLTGHQLQIIQPNIEAYGQSMKNAIASCSSHKIAIDYDAFFEGTQKSRNKTVAEIFVLMLMAIRGVSAEKAAVVQELYDTPRGLVQAYALLPFEERPDMIMNATAKNVTRRKLNAQLSKAIFEIWGSGNIESVLPATLPSSPYRREETIIAPVEIPEPSSPLRHDTLDDNDDDVNILPRHVLSSPPPSLSVPSNTQKAAHREPKSLSKRTQESLLNEAKKHRIPSSNPSCDARFDLSSDSPFVLSAPKKIRDIPRESLRQRSRPLGLEDDDSIIILSESDNETETVSKTRNDGIEVIELI